MLDPLFLFHLLLSVKFVFTCQTHFSVHALTLWSLSHSKFNLKNKDKHADFSLLNMCFCCYPLLLNGFMCSSWCRLNKMGALQETLLTERHQLWRLFTSPWLHAGVFHLIVNLFSVIYVGVHLVQEFGPGKILLLLICMDWLLHEFIWEKFNVCLIVCLLV